MKFFVKLTEVDYFGSLDYFLEENETFGGREGENNRCLRQELSRELLNLTCIGSLYFMKASTSGVVSVR